MNVVRRRAWIALFAIVAIPLIAVLFSMRQEREYRATAQVLLNPQDLSAVVAKAGGAKGEAPLTQRVVSTQEEVATLPAVADRTLKALNLTDRTPTQLLDHTRVSRKGDTDILSISVTDGSRTLARELANEYATQYTAYRYELDTSAIDTALADTKQKLAQLEKTGDRSSTVHANLVEKQQLLSTMKTLQASNARVVRTATDATKIQPQTLRNGLYGLLIGVVAGLGLAGLREALDTRVRSADAVAAQLGLPLIGNIPPPPRRVRKDDLLVMLEDPNSPEAEAFRVLRTNFEFVNLERGATSIMVTSGVAGEGKSTTVSNLAIALALAGRHVALVDLDLRRPYLHRLFLLDRSPGLTNVVLGEATLDEALTPVVVPTSNGYLPPTSFNGSGDAGGMLEVLGTGPLPPDPGEFVLSPALREVLAELGERAEIVLIDAPPLLSLGDTFTFSEYVDALLVVTRLHMIRRPMLNDLSRLLDTSPAVKLGLVVAGAALEEKYGYGYGYGDEYEDDYGKRPKRRSAKAEREEREESAAER